MARFNWILNILFLIVLVVFIGLDLWLAAEADRAHACLMDQACVERYRTQIERVKQNSSYYQPSAHPAYLNGKYRVFFY